jgi:signal transduction histidine kinase
LSDPKSDAAAAIARAQSNLDQALADLANVSALDARSVELAAHALNNFLTVAEVVVGLLLRSLRDHPERQVLLWLEGLGHATNLMSRTVSQLVSNSRGLDEPSVKLEDVDLSVLVQRACAYYQQAAKQKHIKMTFSRMTEVPSVRTDRVIVAAILDNLLSNAVKFSPPGSHVDARLYGEPGSVVCSVRDEGPGLSREDQAHLFQPGVRLGPSPTAGEPSSGYGLAIARRFTESLGGDIWCTSTPGEGATFSFRLPVSSKSGPAPASPV